MGTTAILTLQHSPHKTHPFNPMSSFIVNVSWMRMGWRMAPRSSRVFIPLEVWVIPKFPSSGPFHHGQPETCLIITQLDPSLKVPQLDPLLQADQFKSNSFSGFFGTSPFTPLPFLFFAKTTRLVRSYCRGKWAKSLCFAGWGDFVPFCS